MENSSLCKNCNKKKFFGKTTVPMVFNVPLIAPDVWRSGYPGFVEKSRFTETPGKWGDQIGRFVFIRHDDRNNIAFVDGHVERVYLPEIGLLKWHREWVCEVLNLCFWVKGKKYSMTR